MYLDRSIQKHHRSEAVQQILDKCGLQEAYILFNGKDYYCTISDMRHEGRYVDVELPHFKETIKTTDELMFITVILGKKYIIKAEVTHLKFNGMNLLCEINIMFRLCLDMQETFSKMCEEFEVLNNRNFDRIYLDSDTLKEFPINPRMEIIMPRRKYVCYAKNISINGVSFVTTPDFKDEKDEKYNINIEFKEPFENLTVSGKLMRKTEVKSGENGLLECGMQLEDNIYLSRRVMGFLRKFTLKRKKNNKLDK